MDEKNSEFLKKCSLAELNAFLLLAPKIKEFSKLKFDTKEIDFITAFLMHSKIGVKIQNFIPRIMDDESLLFCDSITTTKKYQNGLPYKISLIHRDNDGSERRATYKFENLDYDSDGEDPPDY